MFMYSLSSYGIIYQLVLDSALRKTSKGQKIMFPVWHTTSPISKQIKQNNSNVILLFNFSKEKV